MHGHQIRFVPSVSSCMSVCFCPPASAAGPSPAQPARPQLSQGRGQSAPPRSSRMDSSVPIRCAWRTHAPPGFPPSVPFPPLLRVRVCSAAGSSSSRSSSGATSPLCVQPNGAPLGTHNSTQRAQEAEREGPSPVLSRRMVPVCTVPGVLWRPVLFGAGASWEQRQRSAEAQAERQRQRQSPAEQSRAEAGATGTKQERKKERHEGRTGSKRRCGTTRTGGAVASAPAGADWRGLCLMRLHCAAAVCRRVSCLLAP
jgi:hypothetical protein